MEQTKEITPKMSSLKKLEDLQVRPDIIRSKRIAHIIYGAWTGIAFALASWGLDARLLQSSHAYLPYLKLHSGLILCGAAGGLAGYLLSRVERTILGILIWLAAGVFFGWLTVAIPLQITPVLVKYIDPELGSLLQYTTGPELYYRYTVACLWACLFTFLIGVSQVPLVEQIVFSTAWLRKIMPFFFSLVIMLISGTIGDTLINVFLRESITAMDQTIEFVIENRGKEVDPAVSRRIHAAALRNIESEMEIAPDHALFVGSYDEFFGNISVLARFNGKWFNCTVVYNQPSLCK